MNNNHAGTKVLVAGATGYLGKFVAHAFKARGYWVRVLTRRMRRLERTGPFTAPAIMAGDMDDIFVGELTDPASLKGLMDDIDIVFSSVGISRQRDKLSFEQVDYELNRLLIELAEQAGVKKFVYVSMLGEDQIADLAITRAHEKVVERLKSSTMDFCVVRPSGYFSDMGVLLDMARRGRVYLVGKGNNNMNPIHGRDLAEVCVDAAEGTEKQVEAGGPDIMTQREAALLAFEVVGKPAKLTVIPLWLAFIVARLIRLVSRQFGDMAEFIVTAGEVEGVGPKRGTSHLRDYFQGLLRGDPDP